MDYNKMVKFVDNLEITQEQYNELYTLFWDYFQGSPYTYDSLQSHVCEMFDVPNQSDLTHLVYSNVKEEFNLSYKFWKTQPRNPISLGSPLYKILHTKKESK